MKKVLILAMGVVLAANVAFADHLGIYAEETGNTCTKVVPGPFLTIPVYVVHKFTAGTTGTRFKVTDATGLLQLSNATDYAVLGTSPFSGVSVAYGSCKTGTIKTYTLNFMHTNPAGPAATCGKLEVVGDPLAPGGLITSTGCDFIDRPATGGQFFFNPNGQCVNCNEVATEATTWGTIKALYK